MVIIIKKREIFKNLFNLNIYKLERGTQKKRKFEQTDRTCVLVCLRLGLNV